MRRLRVDAWESGRLSRGLIGGGSGGNGINAGGGAGKANAAGKMFGIFAPTA